MHKTLYSIMLLIGAVLMLGCSPLAYQSDKISSVTLSSYSGFGVRDVTFSISSDGTFSYFESRGISREDETVVADITGQLPQQSVDELSASIESNGFFTLPADLSNRNCYDAPTTYIEVKTSTRTHKVGGYCVENTQFSEISQDIYKLIEQAQKTVNSS